MSLLYMENEEGDRHYPCIRPIQKLMVPVLTLTILTFYYFFLRRRFIEISKILYRIVENKDIRKYNMIETKVRARVNIDC